ncbi:MAG TPA: Rieske 2Fe-2S domain-containing protein, partial [Methylomirabilota bacterium]
MDPTAIIVSHEHLDHVDPWFLSRVPPHVPVIVPRYPSPALQRKIARGGAREVIQAEQWQRVEIAPGTRVFFVSEPPMNHDSAVVIEGDGQTLLDLNDARLFPIQIREIRQHVGGTIDLFAFQGAGASWYPMCYGYPPERAAELSRQKRLAKLGYCLRTMKLVEPVMGLPFAGPPAFLDPALFRSNDEMDGGIFLDQQQVAEFLVSRGLQNVTVLLPGDVWDHDARAVVRDEKWKGFSFADRRSYLEDFAARRRPHVESVLARHPEPTRSVWEPFQGYFGELLTLSPYFNAKIDMRVGFDVVGAGGGAWHVDFRPGREGGGEGIEGCGYLYRFDSRWLPGLVDGSTPWEDFFLSLRFEARRDPDRYNDHLLGLLKFANADALREVEASETAEKSTERIIVHAEGRAYSISRYCPHAGNDLLNTGEVLPGGVLRCLAHHYDFSLTSGECLTGNCAPLAVDVVDA